MADRLFAGTEMRIVLLGKTGAGKSACGNRILRNPKAFVSEISPNSVTTICKKKEATVDGSALSVIDTPGVFDTEMNEVKLRIEVGRCIELSVPGPHAFLLVIRLDVRFTEEENKAIEWIKENFGEGALLYSIVLFTHADQIRGKSVEEYINGSKDFHSVLNRCGSRYHAFNNSNGDDVEIQELLKKIKEMVTNNRGQHYTNDKYKEAQKKLNAEKKKEKLITGALSTMTAVGTGAAIAGGAALAVAEAAVIATAAVAAGAALAVGAGTGLIADAIKKKRPNVKKHNSEQE